MKKNKKAILFVFLVLFMFVFSGSHAFGADMYKNQEIIPGASGQTDCLPDYIKQIIGFGFAVIGILAMFMLCIGAYQYLMAAGNIGSVEKAKDTIASALLGLVLGLTAWIILYKINPDLVSMRLDCSGSAAGTPGGSTGGSPGTPTAGSTSSKVTGDLSKVKCETVQNYDGFMNKNLSDGLSNETKVNSAQDLQNALQNIRTTGNGLTQYSDTIYQACKDNNVPYWYAIGTFAQESNLFSEGNKGCSKFNNPGCMMSNGKYINYATPEEGIQKNIANMGRLLQKYPTPLGAWNAWYWPDRPGNCAEAQSYLDKFKWTANATGLSGI
jgi:hypothetical protein